MLHRTRRPRAALPRTKGNPRRRPLGLHIIRDLDRAYSLLHPVRRRILEMLSEPESSAGISHRLKLPRQKVNYHVKEMARTRLLLPAGRKRKRRFYEQCYVASAKAYVLSPELLGKLAADAGTMPDRLSAGHLLGLAAQMQKEVNRAMDLTPGGKKVATLSLNGEVRFTSAEQRAGFTRALEKAIVDVVGKHAHLSCIGRTRLQSVDRCQPTRPVVRSHRRLHHQGQRRSPCRPRISPRHHPQRRQRPRRGARQGHAGANL